MLVPSPSMSPTEQLEELRVTHSYCCVQKDYTCFSVQLQRPYVVDVVTVVHVVKV